ncbi:hypothetical protein GGR57DRAFT_35768 [Xylariaceae sp. FL1272]|nr:hypothetical protein GGR57DRAFT_35768 [Xylariaceae sp. FL1272]
MRLKHLASSGSRSYWGTRHDELLRRIVYSYIPVYTLVNVFTIDELAIFHNCNVYDAFIASGTTEYLGVSVQAPVPVLETRSSRLSICTIHRCETQNKCVSNPSHEMQEHHYRVFLFLLFGWPQSDDYADCACAFTQCTIGVLGILTRLGRHPDIHKARSSRVVESEASEGLVVRSIESRIKACVDIPPAPRREARAPWESIGDKAQGPGQWQHDRKVPQHGPCNVLAQNRR